MDTDPKGVSPQRSQRGVAATKRDYPRITPDYSPQRHRGTEHRRIGRGKYPQISQIAQIRTGVALELSLKICVICAICGYLFFPPRVAPGKIFVRREEIDGLCHGSEGGLPQKGTEEHKASRGSKLQRSEISDSLLIPEPRSPIPEPRSAIPDPRSPIPVPYPSHGWTRFVNTRKQSDGTGC